MAENVRNPLEKACDAAGRVLRGTHDSFWDAPECSFNDAFVILDKNLNFVAMNDIAQKLFKRFVGDVMGKNILDVFPDIKKTERYYEYVRVIKTGKPFFADDFAPSSTFGDVRLSVKAFKVGNGLGLVVADLTERKRLEVKFAEAEAKYRALVENSTDGIGISRGGQVIYANKAALEIFGFETLEEIRRGSFIDMVVPEDLPFIQDRIEKRLKGEPVPPRFELRIRRTDGEFREIEVIASEVVLNGEKLVQSIYRDITERRKAEEALHFIRFALDNTDEAMVCVSQDARYIDVNDTFCHSVGYSREELLS
ncbi:MAG: PAS domain S-box protein, partial [Chloroflexi bacterium]|nr:PAS domain S-box protein [Chloroflexota bacterium]